MKEEQKLSQELKDYIEEKRQNELKDLKEKRLKEEQQSSRELEILTAKQELDLATVERQVYEEEFERGGYLPPGKPITVEQPWSSQLMFTILRQSRMCT